MSIHGYSELVSIENLLQCWEEFKTGKRSKSDVMSFEHHLEDNIFKLHEDLESGNYHHGRYSTFHVFDPKHRIISKASVRDRLVHHVVFKELYQVFEPSFIYHSYSSRLDKGTHLAVLNFAKCLRKVSRNYTRSIYVLKCDIRKFFWNMDHQKLLAIIQERVNDRRLLNLIEQIVSSFEPVDNFVKRERERA